MTTCPTCLNPDCPYCAAKDEIRMIGQLLSARPGETVVEAAKRWRETMEGMLADEWPETVDSYDKGTTIEWCWQCQSPKRKGHRGFCVMLKVRKLLGREIGKVRDGGQRARELLGGEK